jgi:two-component system, NarL family, nitrate/nitrite response regulator NarL
VVAWTNPEQTSGGTVASIDELTSPRAVLVDPHALLSHALSEELNRTGIETTPLWAESGEEILRLVEQAQPHVVLLEFELPDPPGAPQHLIEAMTAAGARVVMLTSNTDHLALGACLEAGAVGIVDKKLASFSEFVAAIRAAAWGDGDLSWQSRTLLAELRRSRAEEQRRQAPFADLTTREREVLTLMCEGRGTSEIAEETYVSLATVRSHVRSILLKLGVHSQLAAAAKAYSSGWYQA